MRISKRLREEAADICQIVASNYDAGIRIANIWHVIDVSCEAVKLADQAYMSPDVPVGQYAEAEALLRTGWEP